MPTMNASLLSTSLADLPLGGLRFFDQLDSTNSEASRWIDARAPHLALVVADEQTAGRGRKGRTWFTPPGAALAFSLVLRPSAAESSPQEPALSMRLTALGALAVCDALGALYNLPAQIKWSNDVLLDRRKTAGILVESHWSGNLLQASILGIGINLAPESVPAGSALLYPATCVQAALGQPVDRLELLHAVLERILYWRERLGTPQALEKWEQYLAFKGEWVTVIDDSAPPASQQRTAQVLGLDSLGCLRLQDLSGNEFSLLTGELSLRPLED